MPNIKEIPITVGLGRPDYVTHDAITQGDVDAYQLSIRLTGYGDLTGRAELRFVLPDGQTADREAEITDGNLITCMMDAPLYSQEGDLLCAVRLLDENLFTPLFIKFKGVRSVPGDTELTDQVQPYPVWAGELIDRLEEGTAIAIGPTGKGLEFLWDGDKLGVRVEGETEYTKSQSLRGARGSRVEYDWDGTSLALKLEDDEDFDDYVDLKGDQGDFWKPTVDAAGNISWAKAPGSSAPTSQNIKGPIGNTGLQGAKGETGAKGEQGPKGDKGDKGDQGIQGPKGDKGDKGETGDIDNLTALHVTTALGYTPADEDNLPEINIFSGAEDGLVPKPSGAGETGKYLKGDGTWATPPDTVTTINDKTGAISKADIVALGIPAQDTVYTHPPGTNPHGTTKSDIGLGNVTNDKQMPISGGVLENYREKLTTVSASGGSINLSLGNVFQHTPSGNRTYSITNAVTDQAHSFTLIVNMGSTVRTLTFPSSVKWQGGEIPDLTTASKTYVLTFMTVDGGTNWLGMFGGEF